MFMLEDGDGRWDECGIEGASEGICRAGTDGRDGAYVRCAAIDEQSRRHAAPTSPPFKAGRRKTTQISCAPPPERAQAYELNRYTPTLRASFACTTAHSRHTVGSAQLLECGG
ncbi:hypothetical protein DACRYDRAFT_19631 [Dacryopinax primogenitus]|uniref:Uncharacterized protein n=1 Tax=Dacryopinax primogenitus (strain DJM 731) TaxID=1858805 RepID=M5GCY1_DACPD|nr:uncharacterized protein DACRYDRAFT_19631 [Dacryopinax primogenitus]EJU06495.1 hypothetical protein DACRYDRAFT_19631 [Dacryopinax primogenitus]